MSELADRVLAALSIEELAHVLETATEEYTLGSLVAEMEQRARRFEESVRPAEAAQVRFTIARVREQRSVIDRADARRRHLAAGGTARQLVADDAGARMTIEAEIGDLAYRDEVDHALKLVRQAERLPLPDSEFLNAAAARHVLADALRGLGRSREALGVLLYTSAKGIPSQYRNSTPAEHAVARFSNMEGLLQEDVGSYQLGRICYETAAAAAARIGDDRLEFMALTNLAASYWKSGRHQTALRAFRQLLQRAETAGNPSQTGAALNNIALLSDPETGRTCYERVLQTFARYKITGASQSIACFGLGDIAAAEGRFEEAAAACVNGYRLSEDGDAGWRRKATQYLADRLERGDGLTDALLRNPLVFLVMMETLERGDPQFMNSFVLGEARLKAAQGDDEAAAGGLRAVLARPDFRARGAGRGDERRVASDLAEILARSPALADRQEAFDLLWRLRGELLSAPDPADRGATVQSFRRVHEQLVLLLADNVSGLRLPDARPALHLAFDLHEEAKTLPAIGKKAGPATEPATFRQLREHLRGRTELAFVSYLCARERMVVFTYVPAKHELSVHLTPLGAKVIADVESRLRRTFNGDPDRFPPLAPLHPRRPERRTLAFFDELSEPLLSFLGDVSGQDLLCIAPDEPLLSLPLPALRLPDGEHLAVRHAVVNVLSATMLLKSQPLAEPRMAASRVLCAGVAAREDPDPTSMERDARLFNPAAGWDVTEFAGTDVTRDRVLAALPAAQIAHLTCHGHLDSRQHLDSGLLLAHAGARPSRNPSALPVDVRREHLLMPTDIAAASVRLNLVTLRACSAGTQDRKSDEGVTGLAQSLLFSGVSAVVAPLWDVAEESSRHMLAALYRELPATPSEPLWQAIWKVQRRMIQNPDRPWHAHPYHWAAFALFGNWSPL
ncbi:hypothetical protein GCM10022254_41250 [Actinomadura meridiana]|uniref:CHAT domain-containing protein n=1 Tax=Actinomadura meridiana TaxID=559626 RepID=A0ABP8C7J9_9ACTN